MGFRFVFFEPMTDIIKTDKHYKEPFSDYSYTMHGVIKEIAHAKSEFQEIDILDTYDYGKSLFLDGKMQSAAEDEKIYHEGLVHPALIAAPPIKNALVIGGGEGATLREIYRHPTVERAVMVDLDQKVVEMCREYMPEWNDGAFDDARTELVFADGRKWLQECSETFDAIFLDLNEPLEDGPAYKLYTREFYEFAKARLSKNGVLVTQAGPSHGTDAICLASIMKTMGTVFEVVRPITATIPSFTLPWAYCLASHGPDPRKLDRSEVDRRLSIRGINKLHWYDGETHMGIFSLARDVRQRIDRDAKLIEDANPLYIQV